MKNKRFHAKYTRIYLMLIAGALLLTGCSEYEIKSPTIIEHDQNGCTVSIDEYVIVQCGQQHFLVLNELVSEEHNGLIVGQIQQLAVMNQVGKVKEMIGLDKYLLQSMGEKSESWTGDEGERFVPIHHLYELNHHKFEYALDIGGEWFLVVEETGLSSDMSQLTPLELYHRYVQNHKGEQPIRLNEENAERIVIGSQKYEVLDEAAIADCQQGQIGKINTTVVYGRVCKIRDTNEQQEVAVEVNHAFYRARLVDTE